MSASSSGGGPPVCGNGIVEDGEACDDGAGTTCDDVACTWLGQCAIAQFVQVPPGGITLDRDTTMAPNATDFGAACNVADDGTAPEHVFQVTVEHEGTFLQAYLQRVAPFTLDDPILAIYRGCEDEAFADCSSGADCCADSAVATADELLITDALPAGSSVAVDVSGFNGDAGPYRLRLRGYHYLFSEQFEGTNAFTGGSWGPAVGAVCNANSNCRGLPAGIYAADAMTSPEVDVSGIGGLLLGWYQVLDDYALNAADTYRVQISADGGAWQTVFEQPQGEDDLIGENVQLDISANVAGATRAQVRFVLDTAGGSTLGWYVDSVYLLAF